MELIANVPLIGGFLSVLLPFMVVLGVVVFVHEYGHYIVGRWCGIRSEVFSVGFGPVLWSRRDRRGTLWQVALLPLGGYVKFLGDSDGSSRADPDSLARLSSADRKHSFHGASVGRRMLTVLAGPVFNFILSSAIFTGVVIWQGVPTDRPVIGAIAGPASMDQTLREGDVVLSVNGATVSDFKGLYRAALDMPSPGPMRLSVERDGRTLELIAPYAFPPLIDRVVPLSPASEAGVRSGDLVLSADGRPLEAFEDLRQAILASDGDPLELNVLRGDAEISLEVVPAEIATDDGSGGFEKRLMVGINAGPLYEAAKAAPSPLTALGFGVERTFKVITQSLNGLKHIAMGTLGAENLQGPIGIAQISGETASQGLMNFVMLIGVISTAIGMFNLFPIPILDGGHFMTFLFEALRGRPPSPVATRLATSTGLGLILLLMAFATYNDIMRMAG